MSERKKAELVVTVPHLKRRTAYVAHMVASNSAEPPAQDLDAKKAALTEGGVINPSTLVPGSFAAQAMEGGDILTSWLTAGPTALDNHEG